MTLSTAWRFRLVLAAAIVLSAGGILVAAFLTRQPADGGRGGALAVALSFFILFLSRDYGSMVYGFLTKEAPQAQRLLADLAGTAPPAETGATTDQKVEALISKARLDAETQKIQNVHLTAASVIGTLVWGFGDLVAQWLMC